jgi:periodic tryptophan protein 2
MAYSPDGAFLATGGDDGKVKIWTTKNCLCFVTFTEHNSKITACQFIPKKGNAVLTASLDGTVRAFDLVKYRNFRTFTTPKPAQFSSLAIEASGDIVAAGALEPYEIYLWSMKTGQLLETLSSHTGPISSVCFNPPTSDGGSILASSSWDMTVKLWDTIGT